MPAPPADASANALRLFAAAELAIFDFDAASSSEFARREALRIAPVVTRTIGGIGQAAAELLELSSMRRHAGRFSPGRIPRTVAIGRERRTGSSAGPPRMARLPAIHNGSAADPRRTLRRATVGRD